MVFFAALTLAVAVSYWREPYLTAGVLIVFHSVVLWYLNSRRLFLTYLFGFVFGPIAEALSIAAGAWSYANPQFFGVPVWLPFVWGAATVTAGYFVLLQTVHE